MSSTVFLTRKESPFIVMKKKKRINVLFGWEVKWVHDSQNRKSGRISSTRGSMATVHLSSSN